MGVFFEVYFLLSFPFTYFPIIFPYLLYFVQLHRLPFFLSPSYFFPLDQVLRYSFCGGSSCRARCAPSISLKRMPDDQGESGGIHGAWNFCDLPYSDDGSRVMD